MENIREQKRKFRHSRIRKKIVGTSQVPRLCVHRSLKNIQAYLIDDTTGKVLMGKTTLAKDIKSQLSNGGNVSAAKVLGKAVAVEAVGKGIKQVAFDRGGYLYHGRIKAFADAAREAGLQF